MIEGIELWSGRKVDDVLHLGHHRHLVGTIGQVGALTGGANVIAVE
jgi:hypothetical protein